MSNDIKTILDEAAEVIMRKIQTDRDNFYDNVIFEPDYPGQSTFDQYIKGWRGQGDYAIYLKLQDAIAEIESDEGV